MSTASQPRDDDGRFESQPRVSSHGDTSIQISEFEARLIGNRLWEIAEWHEKSNGLAQTAGECKQWAKRFHNECFTRGDDGGEKDTPKRHPDTTYIIKVDLSEFEAKFLGNRLWEMGEKYEQRGEDEVAKENKWWARRFHAEAGECVE